MTDSNTKQTATANPIVAAIPNGLTALRLVFAAMFPFVPQSWWLPLVVLAGLTEFLDGYLSRKWQVTSTLGKIMDPVADKVFVLTVIATLTYTAVLGPWQVAWILARDIAVTGGVIWLTLQRRFQEYKKLPPRILGKIATTGQFLVLLNAVAGRWYLDEMIIAVGLISFLAAVDYLNFSFRVIGAFPKREPAD